MNPPDLSQNPFAVLTLIAAPALLTNASSVLAMSTINRMLRSRDHMRDLLRSFEATQHSDLEMDKLVRQVNRVENQAFLIMRALRSVYVALSAFACSTLIALIGAAFAPLDWQISESVLAGLGLMLGIVGVGGLVVASASLIQATQISLGNIREEADQIRARQEARKLG